MTPTGSKHVAGSLNIFIKVCFWRLLICLYLYTRRQRVVVLCPDFSSTPRTGCFTPRKSPGH